MYQSENNDNLAKVKKNLIIIVVLLLLISIIFIVKLFTLQVLEGKKYFILSTKNIISKQKVRPVRGKILDRNGEPLVVNVFKHNLYLLPYLKEEQLLNVKQALTKININWNIHRYRKNQENLIKRSLTQDQFLKLKVNKEEFPYLFVKEIPSRYYPFKEKFYYPVGYVSLVSQNELSHKKFKKYYDNEDYIGKFGLEKLYEKDLRGIKGLKFLFIDAKGKKVEYSASELGNINLFKQLQNMEKPAINGKNIQLTLDKNLQIFNYNLLKDFAAALVIMNINTGEIISYVSSPSVDPNMFLMGISNQIWSQISQNEKHPLLDKCIQNYNPASTFKLFTAFCGEKLNLVHGILPCRGKIKLEGVVKHCWKKSGHGKETLDEALKNSCNVFFYQLGDKVGIDNYSNIARSIYLDKKTGIEVSGEKKPMIPYRKIKRDLGIGDGVWYPSETLDIAIGQGLVELSPVKMAQFIAFIASKGWLVRPHLIKKIGNKEIETNKIEIEEDPSIFNKITKGMHDVVNSLGGTGWRAKSKKIIIAGKTGTMQVQKITKYYIKYSPDQKEIPYKERDNGWFVSFAPYNNPQYAMVIFIEHNGSGGYYPANFSRNIWEYMDNNGYIEEE